MVYPVLQNMTHILAFWSFMSALQTWVWPFDPPPQALSAHDGAHPQNKAKQSGPCSTQRDCFVSTPPKGIVGSMHHLLTSRTYCGLGLSMGVTLVSCHADRSVAKGPKRSKTGQGIVAALKKRAFWIARNARMLNSGTSRLRCQTLTSAPSPVNANPTAAPIHKPLSSTSLPLPSQFDRTLQVGQALHSNLSKSYPPTSLLPYSAEDASCSVLETDILGAQ